MSNSTQEYILCAAIRLNYNPNKFIAGHRHHNILHDFVDIVDKKQSSQGFLTSTGRWVDRKIAAKIAYESGQIKQPKTMLFSEDLY